MAYYTTFVEQEDRPNLRNHPNLWAVVDDSGERIVAYCLHHKDAEFLKALLAYYGDRLIGDMQRGQKALEEEQLNTLANERSVPRFDGIHCDQLTCERVATHRVRPDGIPIRGMLYCDEHTAMILADGRKRGREWASEPYVR